MSWEKGMRVLLLHDSERRVGRIVAVRHGRALIRFDAFEEWHPVEELVIYRPFQGDVPSPVSEAHPSRPLSRRQPRQGRVAVDLHLKSMPEEALPYSWRRSEPVITYQLAYARQQLRKYLNKYSPVREVVLIHGRGEGKLREALVREVENMGLRWEPAGLPYPPRVAIIVRRR